MMNAGVVLVLLIGLALLWLSRLFGREANMPEGDVIYSDTRALGKQTKALFSQRYRLSGKPDYLVEQAGAIIPVEYKSSKAPRTKPYYGHQLQVGAYCLLVEEKFGVTPPYGVIKYADRDYQVPFTARLRAGVLNAIDDIRINDHSSDVDRDHSFEGRCRSCGFNSVCEQRLV